MSQELEKKILERLASQHLATSRELENHFADKDAVRNACAMLVNQGYLATIYPLGGMSYAITQKGLRAVKTV